MGGGMDSIWPPSLSEFLSVWIPLSHRLSPAMSKHHHPPVSPSLPNRLQTGRVSNIDLPWNPCSGSVSDPGWCRESTWYKIRIRECAVLLQTTKCLSFFPSFFILWCWFLSPGASSRCAFDHRVYFCFLLLPWKRKHSEGGFATSELPGAGIRPLFLKKFRWQKALNDLQMGSHLPVSLDWSHVIWR